jgi:phosphoribosylanthranilate isomerase
MIRVKICGITNLKDALLACELGADALGFNFYPESPRYITPEDAWHIICQLPPLVLSVGVFVDAELDVVNRLAGLVGLDWVQLHGQETPEYCLGTEHRVIKAIRLKDQESLASVAPYRNTVQAFLLDTYRADLVGGTGETFDWSLARQAQKYGPIILAGGLTPENVAQAIEAARPQAVDVASGVESSPGKKDPEKLRAFFAAVRGN